MEGRRRHTALQIVVGFELRYESMNWICLSSGARPLYLENIVRALSLPVRNVIQFRYEREIVSESFEERVSENRAVGDTAYICYLGINNQSKSSQVYPVRERPLFTQ